MGASTKGRAIVRRTINITHEADIALARLTLTIKEGNIPMFKQDLASALILYAERHPEIIKNLSS